MDKALIDAYRDKLLNNNIEYKRDIFNTLYKEIQNFNIVLIGLRQLGKTTIAEQLVKEYVKPEEDKKLQIELQEDDNSTNNLVGHPNLGDSFLYINLKSFTNLTKELIQNAINQANYKIVLIDEIQIINDWSNLVQTIVDLNPDTRFIFTGSNASALLRETAFQRVKIFNLLPLNFKEYQNIWGDHSFENYLYYGSYPRLKWYDNPMIQYKEMVNDIIIEKIATEDNQGIDPTKLKNFAKSIANYIGNEINTLQLAKLADLSRPTTATYIKIMSESSLIRTITKYRDKNRNTKEKVYFVDKSMLPHFVNELNNNDMGALIENLVFSKLVEKYEYQFRRDVIQYFRDSSGNEIDFILEEKKLLVEVKYRNEVNMHQLSNKLNSIINDRFEDYRKIVITKNELGTINGWKFIPLMEYINKKED